MKSALNATALVACVGDIRRFPSGRHFASYLGSLPVNTPAVTAADSERSVNKATGIFEPS